jgi:hypothetical protein
VRELLKRELLNKGVFYRIMNLIEESFQRLFPQKVFPYQTHMEYNRRLSDFNANIKLDRNKISVHLNLQWKDIDREIKIGLIQSLLLRILKAKRNTTNIEVYNNFIKQIPVLTPKTKTDPILEDSFRRVNEKFFSGVMEETNLQWGSASYRKLANYNFHNDSVTVSTLFKNVPIEVLDYLMYHELLHKKHQFEHKNGRSSFHSPSFRREEALYPGFKEIEKEISRIIRKSKTRKNWWDLF